MFSPQQLRQPKKQNHKSGSLPFRGKTPLKEATNVSLPVPVAVPVRVPSLVQMCGTMSVKERLRGAHEDRCEHCSACGRPFLTGEAYRISLITVKPFFKNGVSNFLLGNLYEVHVCLHSSCEMEIAEVYFLKKYILGDVPKACLFPAGEDVKAMLSANTTE